MSKSNTSSTKVAALRPRPISATAAIPSTPSKPKPKPTPITTVKQKSTIQPLATLVNNNNNNNTTHHAQKSPTTASVSNVLASLSDEDELVTVNIGGMQFTSTQRTFAKPIPVAHSDLYNLFDDFSYENNNLAVNTPDSKYSSTCTPQEHFFCILFSGKFSTVKDKDGNIFVNRDGTYFRYILNYLRVEGNIEKTVFPWADSQGIEELILEAEFYNLTSLAKFLKGDEFWLHFATKYSKRMLECSIDGDGFNLSNNQMTLMISKPYQTITVRNIYPLFIVKNEKKIPQRALASKLQKFNYYEVRVDGDLADYLHIGIMPIGCQEDEKNLVHKCKHGFAFSNHASKVQNGNYSNYGEAWKDGDHIGIWVDAVKHKIYFFKNGCSLGYAFTLPRDMLLPEYKWYFVVSFENRTDRPRITLTNTTDRPAIE